MGSLRLTQAWQSFYTEKFEEIPKILETLEPEEKIEGDLIQSLVLRYGCWKNHAIERADHALNKAKHTKRNGLIFKATVILAAILRVDYRNESQELITKAEELLPFLDDDELEETKEWHSTLLYTKGWNHLWSGEPSIAIELGEQALEKATKTGNI